MELRLQRWGEGLISVPVFFLLVHDTQLVFNIAEKHILIKPIWLYTTLKLQSIFFNVHQSNFTIFIIFFQTTAQSPKETLNYFIISIFSLKFASFLKCFHTFTIRTLQLFHQCWASSVENKKTRQCVCCLLLWKVHWKLSFSCQSTN